ncbi:MAG TPA: erythromycin biosynthesis sensory transduction protein eryC1 [Massilia sp.]|nr:erythromycin biosynthesis sensory transduction protein eryC1 [Massilia sp.]
MQQINDLSARIAQCQEQIKAAVNRVVDSGWLVLGPEVKQFETAFAAYLGASDCITVANGTDAIELGLKALGVAPGDQVATVANASMYTTTALLAIGAEPFFMDVDLDSRCATLAEVTRALDAGVKAVVVTHLYGLAAPEIVQIAALCAQRGVPLFEDCAQAHGASVDGKRTGTFGAAASFSFYPTKNLGALGDGGAVVTSDASIAERMRALRQYGWSEKYKVQVAGARNSRLDEMQAAILGAFLPGLDAANARRRAIAERYSAELNHPEVQVPNASGAAYVGHLYVVRSPRRDALRAHLREAGIASDVHYPIPDHRQPLFGDRYADLRLENTERLAADILTLPCYPEMSDENVGRVIAAVNAW